MAKKFSKLVLFGTLVGAAAAGTYYYLQNKKNDSSDDTDDIDDFDDFDDDLDDDDFSSDDANSGNSKNRPYVSLDLDNAKEIIGEKVIETIDKTKETLDKAKEFIGEVTAPTTSTAYTDVEMPSAAEGTAKTEASETTTDEAVNNETKISDTEEFFDDSDAE